MYKSSISSSLIDCRITDRNVYYLLAAIHTGKCPKLEKLILSNNAMSIQGCKALAICFQDGQLTKLQYLDLQRILSLLFLYQ